MKKKTAITVISILAVVALAAGIFSVVTLSKTSEKNRYIEYNFRHAFSELVSGVSEMDNALKKSVLVTSPSMAGTVCIELFGKAQTAEMALGVLPYSAYELEKTAGFINRVGDFAFALSQKAAAGTSFSKEERESLQSLSDTAAVLSQNLKNMENELGSGNISMEQYQKTIKAFDDNESTAIPQTLGESIKLSEQEFPELPSLIYDGPFSEHLKGIKPRALEGMEEIDQAAGRRTAAQFVGIRPEQVYPSAELEGEMPSYSYGTELNGSSITITVSKQGGVVYQLLNSRLVERTELSAKEALDAAKVFLERRGYKNMKESYYLISNNVLTANFAYVQDGVVCYSDLVKVGIALDNGTLQSFEAQGYLTAHYQRELPKPKVSMEEAKAKVPEGISILSGETALVPNAGKNEVLCHEFRCEDENGRHYIIYVNASTGEQEKILILLEDENGTLTI